MVGYIEISLNRGNLTDGKEVFIRPSGEYYYHRSSGTKGFVTAAMRERVVDKAPPGARVSSPRHRQKHGGHAASSPNQHDEAEHRCTPSTAASTRLSSRKKLARPQIEPAAPPSRARAERFDVIVVGGGGAGLAAAYELVAQGVDPSRIALLEGRDRIGGRVHTLALGADSVAEAAAAVRGALDQRSPLHIALLTRAPEEVVLQLLAASPGMVAEPLRDVYSHKKGEGAETPLHTAILRHRRATTIVRMIELGGAVAAALLNSRGEAPLHCALAAGAEPAVFAALVNAAPATVGRRNRQNETALDLAVRHAAPREVFDLMLAASAKPSWLPGNGGKSLIERLIFDHAKIPRAAEYTRSVLRVAPQVAAKLKKGPMSPLLHLALRRSADAATVDAILGAAPRIASGAHLDHKGSGIIELALAWYTRTEATPLAASLGAAMRRRGGGGGGEASACLASQTPCNDAALAKAEVIAHILFRLVRSPMVGPATAAPPIVCACWIAMQRSKLFLVAADQFRKHGPSAERAALFATIFQFMRGVEK
jgi:hypothetical protein